MDGSVISTLAALHEEPGWILSAYKVAHTGAVTSVQGDLTSSTGLLGHYTPVVHRHIQANTHIHKTKNKILKELFFKKKNQNV